MNSQLWFKNLKEKNTRANLDYLQFLKVKGDLNKELSGDKPILHYIVKFDLVEEFKKALDLGVKPVSGSYSVFNDLIQHKKLSFFEYLLKFLPPNFNYDKKDSYSRTPLMVATILNRIDFVDRLLNAYSPDVEEKDRNGLTIIHTASYFNSKTILERFRLAGLGSFYKDNAGDNPLHTACNNGNFEAVSALLKFSDARDCIYNVNKAGLFAVDIIKKNGRAKMISNAIENKIKELEKGKYEKKHDRTDNNQYEKKTCKRVEDKEKLSTNDRETLKKLIEKHNFKGNNFELCKKYVNTDGSSDKKTCEKIKSKERLNTNDKKTLKTLREKHNFKGNNFELCKKYGN
jgi:hypothetical protein